MFNFPEGACPHPLEMAVLKSIESQINHKRLLPGSCLINEPKMAVSVRSLVSRYKYQKTTPKKLLPFDKVKKNKQKPLVPLYKTFRFLVFIHI